MEGRGNVYRNRSLDDLYSLVFDPTPSRPNRPSTSTSTATRPLALPDISAAIQPFNAALDQILQMICVDLGCYGESYKLSLGRSRLELVFEKAHFPDPLVSDARLAFFAGAAKEERYVSGVGLPGIAMYLDSYCIYSLHDLLSDPHVAAGRHLEDAAKLFGRALVVPVRRSRALFTDESWGVDLTVRGRHILGVLVVYLRPGVRESTSLRAYLDDCLEALPGLLSWTVRRHVYLMSSANRPRHLLRVAVLAVLFSVRLQLRLGRRRQASAETASTSVFPSSPLPRKEQEHWGLRLAYTQIAVYLDKCRGGAVLMPKRMPPLEAANAFLGSFLAIAFTALLLDKLSEAADLGGDPSLFLAPSLGALATLVFGLPAAPLAQPRIVLSAHAFTCAVAAVVGYVFLFSAKNTLWLQQALTVAASVSGMGLLGVLHPPAGAAALIIVNLINAHSADGPRIGLGLVSILVGCVVFVVVGCLVVNLHPRRLFPIFW